MFGLGAGPASGLAGRTVSVFGGGGLFGFGAGPASSFGGRTVSVFGGGGLFGFGAGLASGFGGRTVSVFGGGGLFSFGAGPASGFAGRTVSVFGGGGLSGFGAGPVSGFEGRLNSFFSTFGLLGEVCAGASLPVDVFGSAACGGLVFGSGTFARLTSEGFSTFAGTFWGGVSSVVDAAPAFNFAPSVAADFPGPVLFATTGDFGNLTRAGWPSTTGLDFASAPSAFACFSRVRRSSAICDVAFARLASSSRCCPSSFCI